MSTAQQPPNAPNQAPTGQPMPVDVRAATGPADEAGCPRRAALEPTIEEALRASEKRYRDLIELSPDAVFVNRGNRIELVNRAALDLFGATCAEQILGKSPFELFHPDCHADIGARIRRMLDGHLPNALVEQKLVRLDGAVRDVEVAAAFFDDQQGRAIQVVMRDVTERKRAEEEKRRVEEALRESEERVRLKLGSILSPHGDIGDAELADIIDAEALQSLMADFYALARIPMALVDVKGKVLVGVGWQDICTKFHRVHPETCRYCLESDTQLSAGVLPGEFKLYKCKNNMWDIATPLSVAGHRLGNVFSGQFFFEDEPLDYELFRAQAKRYGFDVGGYLAALEAVPRISRESISTGMAFFSKLADMLSRLSYSNIQLARSAAEREALMDSLRESKERLQEADRRKSEFLAVLSHELRNPLAPIRNGLYLLGRAPSGSDQAARATAVISRQVDHLTHLVDDLLDVTRIAHGKIALNRSRIDARDAVRRACEDHRAIFDQRRVALRIAMPAGPVWIDADATRVTQVLGNLLQNAAKFTPEHGSTSVTVGAAEGRAEIRVRDDGIGIEPELAERIFEPFAQAERGLARTQGGLGLGLALVKGLVELHGGSVSALSEGVNRGSEFIVSLPLAVDPELPRGERPPHRAARARCVLVIEDYLDSGQTLADVLALHGHRVHVATDGRSGIAKAREVKPDVVLCDIGLPDVDGYEVARLLRADDALRSTYLVALSGYAQPEDRQRALDAGFDAHLGKPAPLEQLHEMLARLG
jgi:PAS domain S-box-containing protein